MSDQDNLSNGNLVPAGRRDLAPVAAANPLMSRGMSDLAKMQLVRIAEVQEKELSREHRRTELQLLAKTVSNCTRCPDLLSTRTQTVFGIGPLDPDLCFVGEAPGEQEDRQGLPFVGPAGQLLNRTISACGMNRDEVFMLNILKCRPPGNRKPITAEAGNCREYLERQVQLVRPKYICALGATAAQYLLGSSLGINKLRSCFHDFKGIPLICTYHPSYLLRLKEPEKTNKKRDVWDDMKLLLKRMGRPIPGNPQNADAYCNRVYPRYEKKDYDKAIKDFGEAIRLDPKNALAFWNRGCIWYWKKENDKAISDFDEAIRLNPKDGEAFLTRGWTWWKKHNYDLAIKDCDEAIRIDPTNASYYAGRGRIWKAIKNYGRAIKDYEEAIRCNPKETVAYYFYAWLLSTCPEDKVRDGNRAVQLATKACELTAWSDGFALDALAAAYAEVGQFDEAERYQVKAFEDPARGSDRDEFRQRLDLYKQKQPFRKHS